MRSCLVFHSFLQIERQTTRPRHVSSHCIFLRVCLLQAISPYGRTKLFQEDMFRDLGVSDKEWRILLLRLVG